MEGGYPIHDGMGLVDFVQIEEAPGAYSREVVVLPVVIGNELEQGV